MANCLDLPDLLLSKATAGRDKDREFCIAMFVHNLVTLDQVLALIPRIRTLDSVQQQRLRRTVIRWASTVRSD